MTKKRVLFLCTGNSCRSQMADGIINHDFAGQIEAMSAGTEPHGLNQKAVAVMAEIGIDIATNSSDHLSQFEGQSFDYVITLCGDANEKCPLFLGGVKRLHMGFDDPPKATGTDEEIMNVYRRVRDEIRQQLGAFFRKELQGEIDTKKVKSVTLTLRRREAEVERESFLGLTKTDLSFSLRLPFSAPLR